MENKDCQLVFSDGRAPYPFSSKIPLGLILKTAKDRDWPLLAIKTPYYTLSVFTPEAYETAICDNIFPCSSV